MNKQKKSKTGRNDLCPCGSGKKYKYCHLGSSDHDAFVDLAALLGFHKTATDALKLVFSGDPSDSWQIGRIRFAVTDGVHDFCRISTRARDAASRFSPSGILFLCRGWLSELSQFQLKVLSTSY